MLIVSPQITRLVEPPVLIIPMLIIAQALDFARGDAQPTRLALEIRLVGSISALPFVRRHYLGQLTVFDCA